MNEKGYVTLGRFYSAEDLCKGVVCNITHSLYYFIREEKFTAITSEEDYKDPFLKTVMRTGYISTKFHILITSFLMRRD